MGTTAMIRLAWLLVLSALAVSASQVRLPELGAIDDGIVTMLQDSEVGEGANLRFIHVLQHLEAQHEEGKRLGESKAASGSGSGSGSGFKIPHPPGDPHGQAPPDYLHLLPHYAKRGGFGSSKEKRLAVAQAAADRARAYVKTKLAEKKKASLGCPCIGEKYYNVVWKIGMGNGSGSGMSAAHKHRNCMKKHPNEPELCMSEADLRKLTKRMIKKYGKLGPNSSWTKQHEAELNQAARAVLVAMKDEHYALIDAKDDIKRMLKEMPEVFHNGSCGCPATWNEADAARLRLRKEIDTRADAQATKKAASVLYADGQNPPPAVSSPSQHGGMKSKP